MGSSILYVGFLLKWILMLLGYNNIMGHFQDKSIILVLRFRLTQFDFIGCVNGQDHSAFFKKKKERDVGLIDYNFVLGSSQFGLSRILGPFQQ